MRNMKEAEQQMKDFRRGLQDGIPIAMGYVPVSFTFGLMAVSVGMKWWQAILVSMTVVTSAGQFAGLDIMVAGGSLLEMALTQLVINLRYGLMSLSLSQKVDHTMDTLNRFITSFGITDEIFAVAMSRKQEISKYYMYGLIAIPYMGWALGTTMGAVLGGVLPQFICNALGIAIYGMFLAIIIPQAREDLNCLKVILIAVVMSCCFRWVPVLNKVSSGFVIILCAVTASAIGAWLYPMEETAPDEVQEQGKDKVR